MELANQDPAIVCKIVCHFVCEIVCNFVYDETVHSIVYKILNIFSMKFFTKNFVKLL